MLEAVEGRLCLLEAMRRVLLSMLEAVEGSVCWRCWRCWMRWTCAVMSCVLFGILEVVDGGLCSLEPEVMRCVLLRMRRL